MSKDTYSPREGANRFQYRVWHKQLNRWLTDDEWFLDFRGNLRFFDTRDCCLLTIHESGYVIQQFSGLLDQHGKEVFEGDTVITEHNSTGQIKWCEEWNCLQIFLDGSETGRFLNPTEIKVSNILGNVFED